MQCEDIQQRREPILVKQHETHQHQRAGEQVRDVEPKPAHHSPPDTKRSSVASRPSISAAPRNCGTRNTRILAIDVSKTASRMPPTASSIRYRPTPAAYVAPPAPADARPHRTTT